MNLSVEHVLMFALVICALYYLIGKCDCKEGYVDPLDLIYFCENEFIKCVCPDLTKEQDCIHTVNNMETVDPAKGVIKKCSDIAWDVEDALSRGGGSDWFGTAPFCDGKCPGGWTECETSKTGDGDRCWTGNKVRCAELFQ